MAITAHVYQIYIKATPDQVWTAITDSEWTKRYFHSTSFVQPPVEGEAYRTVLADGEPAVEGTVVELRPPSDGRPGRFVVTWRVLYDAAMAEERPGRVEWTVEASGNGLTRVRLVHGDLAFSPLTWAHVKDGWVWVLDSMKTLIETGEPLPSPTVASPASAASSMSGTSESPDWHRAQAVEANNSTWELIDKPDRTDDETDDMVRRAYAAAYHWQRAARSGPENESRASYLIAKVLLLAGQPVASLRAAERSLRTCREHALVDFDLAYAYEVYARALQALGRGAEAAAAWDEAVGVEIADQDDREIVARDLSTPLQTEPAAAR